MGEKKKILMATAFPTHGAGSGALVTTQAKSYVEDGHSVVIITGNNRTDFDKLDGVRYHVVPFTGETEDHEIIEGQAPFNYLMFTTHTESKANFWKVSLEDIETYCEMFKKALAEEVREYDPDVIHAQHNWLLASQATRTGKPVVTTIHGTDLMGYERSKKLLKDIEERLAEIPESAKKAKIREAFELGVSQTARDAYDRLDREKIGRDEELVKLYADRRKYKFYMHEAENSARNSDKIIVISNDQQRRFNEAFPFAADKVELIENGYDPKTFFVEEKPKSREEVLGTLTSNITPDGKIPTDYDTMVLFVGKFADFKGIDSMLTANKIYDERLKAKGLKPLTVIVGSGVLDDKLRAQAAYLGLDNTHFVGRQNHETIRGLQNLDHVIPVADSRDEPFGLVVIEATACGNAIIGSNSGGMTDILNVGGKEIPKKDIIPTPLGVMITPLPERPDVLSDEEKEKLDLMTPDYVLADEEGRKEVVRRANEELGLDMDDAENYFSRYARNSEALAESVVNISDGTFKYDSRTIAEYTLKKYSQPVIRDRLIGVYEEAEVHHKEAEKSRTE